MKEYIKKALKWCGEQLSDGLEKSTIGTVMLFGCFGCIVYLTIKEGGSDTVESLITTAMIISATLLGVNSVADVFKVNNNVGKSSE
jgi:coenzyme F420-reducing hydrogenase gamma subunit